MAGRFFEKAATFLEWLEHAYFIGYILLSLGAGRAVNALLVTFTSVPELWRIPIWLVFSGLVMVCLTSLGNHFGRQKLESAPPPQSDPPPPLVSRPTVAAEEAEEAEERIFVDVPPEYLSGFFKEHTSIQAQRLLTPYIGKWMKSSGHLGEVGRIRNIELVQVVFQESTAPNVILFFSIKWADRLSVMRRGDPLSVIGKIDRVSETYVSLDDCELAEAIS